MFSCWKSAVVMPAAAFVMNQIYPPDPHHHLTLAPRQTRAQAQFCIFDERIACRSGVGHPKSDAGDMRGTEMGPVRFRTQEWSGCAWDTRRGGDRETGEAGGSVEAGDGAGAGCA